MATIVDGWTLTRYEHWMTDDGMIELFRHNGGYWSVSCNDDSRLDDLEDSGLDMAPILNLGLRQLMQACHETLGSSMSARITYVHYHLHETPLVLSRKDDQPQWSFGLMSEAFSEQIFFEALDEWTDVRDQLTGRYRTRQQAIATLGMLDIDRDQLPVLVRNIAL